jgi:hypothetical protein
MDPNGVQSESSEAMKRQRRTHLRGTMDVQSKEARHQRFRGIRF